jgi:N-acetylglucosaminyldiphosphoundecaprenol N-acetyl-beta-D-mannosaminyltransferase
MAKCRIAGVEVDIISKDRLQESIQESVRLQRRDVYAYVNIHAINLAQENDGFLDVLNSASVVYCDGEGVRLGARLLGTRLPPRVVLTYFVWELWSACEQHGTTVFLLGGKRGVAEEAVAIMRKRFPRLVIAGCHHGYFEKTGPESDRVVSLVNSVRPNILFVGFGMPVQEQWIGRNLAALHVNAILPCGSMIDYAAGRKSLAPAWMSGHGMEWLYRLLQEPGRLWKRYLVGNPLFMIRVFRQRVAGWKEK